MSDSIATTRPTEARRDSFGRPSERPGREVLLVGAVLPKAAPASPRRIVVRGGRPYRVASVTGPSEADPRRYLHLEPAAPLAR